MKLLFALFIVANGFDVELEKHRMLRSSDDENDVSNVSEDESPVSDDESSVSDDESSVSEDGPPELPVEEFPVEDRRLDVKDNNRDLYWGSWSSVDFGTQYGKAKKTSQRRRSFRSRWGRELWRWNKEVCTFAEVNTARQDSLDTMYDQFVADNTPFTCSKNSADTCTKNAGDPVVLVHGTIGFYSANCNEVIGEVTKNYFCTADRNAVKDYINNNGGEATFWEPWCSGTGECKNCWTRQVTTGQTFDSTTQTCKPKQYSRFRTTNLASTYKSGECDAGQYCVLTGTGPVWQASDNAVTSGICYTWDQTSTGVACTATTDAVRYAYFNPWY